MTTNEIEELKSIAQKISPIVHLHSKDEYRPSSVEWYLDNKVELWNGDTRILKRNEVSAESILKHVSSEPEDPYKSKREWYLSAGDIPRKKETIYWYDPVTENIVKIEVDDLTDVLKTYNGNLDSAPIYVHFLKESGRYFIQFWMFYPYNGAMGCSDLNCGPLDGYYAHEGDWEVIMAEVSWSNDLYTLISVNYQAHGDNNWKLIKNQSNVKLDDLKQIVAYSAWHSHASYDSPGEKELSSTSFASDYCDNEGPIWDTSKKIEFLDINEPNWLKYPGNWGTNIEIRASILFLPARVGGPVGPSYKGDWINSNLSTTVYATFGPQNGQSFRCSDNFPKWNVPEGYYISINIDDKAKKQGVPVIALNHDRVGPDTRWYTGLRDNSMFNCDTENGGAASHAIYVGTLSPTPINTKPIEGFFITASFHPFPIDVQPSKPFIPPAGAKSMGSVDVYYKPQNGQSFRCSKNFPQWKIPKKANLYALIELSPGHIQMPTFALDHDKVGNDTRWYSGITNGSVWNCDAQNGGSGDHAIYVGTVSPLPEGVKGEDTYKVTIYAL